jgi:hypothetical protein
MQTTNPQRWIYNVLTVFFAAAIVVLLPWVAAHSTTLTDTENLFRKGILPSGSSLMGSREGGGSISGTGAACVNCHRRSGLGTVEGRIVIPPITAKYLFHPSFRSVPSSKSARGAAAAPTRPAYTDATLGQAIRDGIDSGGRALDYLMPRYHLGDTQMASLIAYLKELSTGKVPGVTLDTLHFAAIITPDADPAKRQGMLDVLQHFFASKNAFYQAKAPPLQSSRWLDFRVQRKWQLHVWELTGAPQAWEEQLRRRLQAEPVFAAISGIAGSDWTPVHKFCEQESLPCLFPNVDLPVIAEEDFYSVYYSKGVLLEAQLMAKRILETSGDSRIRRVGQVYREDDIGASAAKALHNELSTRGYAATDRALNAHAVAGDLASAIKKAGAEDALVLWLRPEDIRNLPDMPQNIPAVFLSGLMGGLEKSPLSGDWRMKARMAYPLELPSKRSVFLNYPLGWFRIQRIPVVAERTQVDTYIACGILSDNLNDMRDDFIRDYLVENIEVMLSPRIINGYYTRLGLAPGQRFASKGGYVVHFADAESTKLIPDGDWIVP